MSLSLEVVTSVVQSHTLYLVMDVPAGNRQSVSTLLTFHHSPSIKTPGLTVFFPQLHSLRLTVDLQSKVVPFDGVILN